MDQSFPSVIQTLLISSKERAEALLAGCTIHQCKVQWGCVVKHCSLAPGRADVYWSGCSLIPGVHTEISRVPQEAEACQAGVTARGDWAAAAGSGLSTGCEVMWIPWLAANTWILWKPQESSTEKVNIPAEPVLIRKPGYRRRGTVWRSRVSSGSRRQPVAALGSPSAPSAITGSLVSLWKVSPQLLLLGPFARTFGF